jgi:hypothetical protein
LLGPLDLAPGESELFSGGYTVTTNSNPATNTVTASGTETCHGRTVTAAADCFGPVFLPPLITSVAVTKGMATVTWTATPGVTYRFQWALEPGSHTWGDVTGDVIADGNTACKDHAMGTNKQRFYRVIVVQ